jgi:cytoskeletal protein CcmA (bactofilin family)
MSSDSTLSSITVNGTTVAENGVFNISDPTTTSVTVSATPTDSNATYSVSGDSGLQIGSNTITITVTAQDLSTSDHTITVYVGNSDTTVSLIIVNGTSVSTTINSPSTVNVPNGTTSVIVGCIPAQSTTTVTSITGNTGLITGSNTISILITAQNTYTSTFYVYINVAQNSDSTLSSILVNGYSVAENGNFVAPLGTTSVTVSATPTKSTSSVTNVTENTGLVSGSNTVTITVRAEDGTTSSHYVYIVVQKWLSLSNTTNIFRQSYINGFVDVSGTTLLRSSTSITGNLVGGGATIITRDVSMNSRLFVGGDVSINRSLFVTGNVIANYPSGSIPTTVFTGPFNTVFSSDIIGGNRLFISNVVSLNSRLSVGQDVSMNGNLQILSGNVIFGGSNNVLFINNSGITFNSDVSMNSRLFASNIVTNNTTLSGNSVIGGTLNSTGNVTVNNNLSVTNLSVFNGDVSMNGILQINGFSRFVGDVSMNSRLFVDGNISTTQNVIANGATLTSDYRIKENVISLDGLYSVDNLHPVHYYNKLTHKRDIGLIAHEIQEVYPILVNGEKDGEEYQNINYIGLIPILIREIKELKKIDKDIETRLREPWQGTLAGNLRFPCDPSLIKGTYGSLKIPP